MACLLANKIQHVNQTDFEILEGGFLFSFVGVRLAVSLCIKSLC